MTFEQLKDELGLRAPLRRANRWLAMITGSNNENIVDFVSDGRGVCIGRVNVPSGNTLTTGTPSSRSTVDLETPGRGTCRCSSSRPTVSSTQTAGRRSSQRATGRGAVECGGGDADRYHDMGSGKRGSWGADHHDHHCERRRWRRPGDGRFLAEPSGDAADRLRVRGRHRHRGAQERDGRSDRPGVGGAAGHRARLPMATADSMEVVPASRVRRVSPLLRHVVGGTPLAARLLSEGP